MVPGGPATPGRVWATSWTRSCRPRRLDGSRAPCRNRMSCPTVRAGVAKARVARSAWPSVCSRTGGSPKPRLPSSSALSCPGRGRPREGGRRTAAGRARTCASAPGRTGEGRAPCRASMRRARASAARSAESPGAVTRTVPRGLDSHAQRSLWAAAEGTTPPHTERMDGPGIAPPTPSPSGPVSSDTTPRSVAAGSVLAAGGAAVADPRSEAEVR